MRSQTISGYLQIAKDGREGIHPERCCAALGGRQPAV